MRRLLLLALFPSGFIACGTDPTELEPASEQGTDSPLPSEPMGGRVLAIGDSILEWNADTSRSIPDVYAETSSRPLTNESVGGARLLAGERSIPSQYAESARNFSQVILDGGGNDVGGDGCGCGDCLGTVDLIVSADAGRGRMVELVNQIIGDGSEAVLLGYYMPPPFGEFAACDEEFIALNTRYAALATSSDSIHFVNMGDVIDHRTNPEYFDDDIHPSVAGSRVVGQYIAESLSRPD